MHMYNEGTSQSSDEIFRNTVEMMVDDGDGEGILC